MCGVFDGGEGLLVGLFQAALSNVWYNTGVRAGVAQWQSGTFVKC